jgi:predicted nucleotidyltransferase
MNELIKLFENFNGSEFDPIKSFKLKDELCQKIWHGDVIDKKIREDLLQLAHDYFDALELRGIKIKDIILTGSLSNYNWSKYSDFDLHILFDFEDINEDIELVRKYLDAFEKDWKWKHDIKIKGFDVEIYCQNSSDKHHSTGIFSLMDNRWILRPKRIDFEVDDKMIKKKSSYFMSKIDNLYSLFKKGHGYREIGDDIKKLWKKIKSYRQSGLDKSGELSTENLVFKLLRRNGYIEKFVNLKSEVYDSQYD